jgi:Mg-chelatase subunit ChlD
LVALAPGPAAAQRDKKGVTKKSVDSDAAAGLIRYEVAGGESYFALSLRARSLPAAGAHDHVILVDTSASQAGAHRRQALAVLDACLAALDKSDRVRLIAFDVKVTPLAEDFHPPQSDETKQAVARLKQIVPLGATSLQPALEAALKSFTGERGRSIIYIGDGMSTAKLIPLPDLRDLIGRLRKARVPVNSFAVGPRTDLQLLGSVAVHTGGTVLVDALIDEAKVSPEQVGKKLAAAAAATVFYPERITLTPEVDELLPEVVPPIRADREAILLGKGRVADTLKVAAAGDGRSLDWTVKPAATQPGNTFLVGLWGLAEKTEGLAVAVAGQELLEVARQEFEDNLVQLVALGKQAVAVRNLKEAEQIADMIRQVDPANVEAQTILNAVQKAKAAAAALDREKKNKGK